MPQTCPCSCLDPRAQSCNLGHDTGLMQAEPGMPCIHLDPQTCRLRHSTGLMPAELDLPLLSLGPLDL